MIVIEIHILFFAFIAREIYKQLIRRSSSYGISFLLLSVAIKPKQKIILSEKINIFEKSLIELLINYIFLLYFSLTGMKPDPKGDTFQTQLTQ